MLLDIPDRDESIEEMFMGDEVIDHNQLKHPAKNCRMVQCLDRAPVNKDLSIH
jgi:hypothetical protein